MALVRASRNARLLLLVRHGKAAPKNVGLTDFERVLTEEGQADCDRVARDVRMLGLKLDLILSSPADRALETAHLFAGRVNYPYSQIGIVDSLYTSPAIRPQVALIRTLKKSVRTVALCGHNPSFDQLASYFICNPARSLAKGAVMGISFDIESWQDAGRGAGRCAFLLSPKESAERTSSSGRRRLPRA